VTDGGLLSRRTRRLLVGGCVLVLFALVAYAGVLAARSDAPAPTRAGQVRLGPDPGEAVAEYLARLPAALPAPGERAFALVQLSPEITTDAAAALVGTAPVAQVVLRVPLPRVQTALRFLSLPPGAPVAGALDTARAQAGFAAEADASRLTGRAGDVARAEAAAYAGPCACVLALVVQSDRAGLETLARTPGVRAVDAAPPGVPLAGLALAPLLPEQTVTADPVPDDGPVP
jgi:hypothetical protein